MRKVRKENNMHQIGRSRAGFVLGAVIAAGLWLVAQPVRAGDVTYDFSIFIPTEDARGVGGVAEGPWVGQTLTGFATYDDTSWTELEASFGIEFEVRDLELHLPSGTTLTEEDFTAYGIPPTFILPFEPYFGFTAFLNGKTAPLVHGPPDPQDLSIYSLNFTVNNTGGAGFRYWDGQNSSSPHPFVNGYYGQVTYALRAGEALEALIAGVREISPAPSDGQMANSSEKVNANRRKAVHAKLASAINLLDAGNLEGAREKLEALRRKVDCFPIPPDWFVCGSDAQIYLLLAIDQLLEHTAGTDGG